MLATKFSYKFPKVGEPIFIFNLSLPQPADLDLVSLGIGGELLDLVEEPRGQEQSMHGKYGENMSGDPSTLSTDNTSTVMHTMLYHPLAATVHDTSHVTQGLGRHNVCGSYEQLLTKRDLVFIPLVGGVRTSSMLVTQARQSPRRVLRSSSRGCCCSAFWMSS